MNSVNLVGRFTRDPDVKYTNGGATIASFNIACDRQFKTQDGVTADFISCKAFGKTAEFIEKYFHKGMRIGLRGRIQTGSYTNKDNQKVYTTDVIAENVEFVESKRDDTPKTDNDGFMNIPEGVAEELPF